MDNMEPIHVIGGGLAGCEAAWQIARAGGRVILHEMRPGTSTPAHQTDQLAELVCSNSFRSDDAEYNAVGLLHAEMRACDSLIMACGDCHKVPAGGALAVDRNGFAAEVGERLSTHKRVAIERGEVAGLPPADWPSVIVATGPLTSAGLKVRRSWRSPAKRTSPSSMPSRRSFTRSRSTSTWPGFSRATTRAGRPATAATTSTAR